MNKHEEQIFLRLQTQRWFGLSLAPPVELWLCSELFMHDYEAFLTKGKGDDTTRS